MVLEGSFPYNSEEVKHLEKEGIKAILNINMFEETNTNLIQWDIVTKNYADKEFEIIDIQINEFDTIEASYKVRFAASILNNLIINHNKVYIHCTYGKWKATEVVINYLCLYKKFSLEAAMKFIRINKPKTSFKFKNFGKGNFSKMKNRIHSY